MRVRSRLLAAVLRAHARRRVLRGRSELFTTGWLTLLREGVWLHGGRHGTVRELDYSIRSRRLRCLVELPGGARLLLDPEDIVGAINTRYWEAVGDDVPTRVEGG